jgi:sulfide dehydrogenase cytochrome subunit
MKKKIVLAAALASLCAPVFAQAPDADTSRSLAAPCALCHGTNGVNAGGLPNIAGMPREYIVQQLRDFRDGKRPATIMHQVAKGYTEPQFAALAEYFAAQKGK